MRGEDFEAVRAGEGILPEAVFAIKVLDGDGLEAVSRESWVHSLLRAACPHRLKAKGAFTAAGSRPAPPQRPPLANLGCIHCCGRPQSPPFANLECIHCYGRQQSPRESWVHSLLRAACPHRLKAKGAFTAAGSLPAPPQSPPLANLGCIHCCGQPARTASKLFPCESWVHSSLGLPARPQSPPRILGAFTAAGNPPARPQSPPSQILGASTAAGRLPARPQSPDPPPKQVSQVTEPSALSHRRSQGPTGKGRTCLASF